MKRKAWCSFVSGRLQCCRGNEARHICVASARKTRLEVLVKKSGRQYFDLQTETSQKISARGHRHGLSLDVSEGQRPGVRSDGPGVAPLRSGLRHVLNVKGEFAFGGALRRAHTTTFVLDGRELETGR